MKLNDIETKRQSGENFIAYLLRINSEDELRARSWDVEAMKEYINRDELGQLRE